MSETEEDRGYYQAAEAAFIRRRGTPFLLSPRDFALLKEWRALGVPIEAIEQGIDEAFSRREERSAGRGRVNSLSYCRDAVLEAWERRLQTSVGRGNRDRAAEPDVPARSRPWQSGSGRSRACGRTSRRARIGAAVDRTAGEIAEERRRDRGFPGEAGQAPGRRPSRRAVRGGAPAPGRRGGGFSRKGPRPHGCRGGRENRAGPDPPNPPRAPRPPPPDAPLRSRGGASVMFLRA